MLIVNFQKRIEQLLNCADVRIGGDRPWDVQVLNNKFYSKLFAKGSMGLGESYMDCWWDCDQLNRFFSKILRARLDTRIKPWTNVYHFLKARLFNLQKPLRAAQVGKRHYDIGNDLYKHMLGKRLVYSCGYWENAASLDEAQESKLDLVCRKLHLEPGMRVLDIGCGWGEMARFAAKRYKVEVVGITISKEQIKFGNELCRGLPIEIRLQDYRAMTETFDRILSLGMFEHVGYKNYRVFFRVVKRCLKENGLFLLHTIGKTHSRVRTDPWIEHYIFPNYMLPSAKQICASMEGLFVIEDWHSFGTDYYKTLMHWFKNFDKSWDAIKDDYDERFYRMWKYYLMACAGSFHARRNQLWQIVLSSNGFRGEYPSVR